MLVVVTTIVVVKTVCQQSNTSTTSFEKRIVKSEFVWSNNFLKDPKIQYIWNVVPLPISAKYPRPYHEQGSITHSLGRLVMIVKHTWIEYWFRLDCCKHNWVMSLLTAFNQTCFNWLAPYLATGKVKFWQSIDRCKETR